ncbi:MAG TPA: pilus assembly protein PilM [Elusimicrobiota bacterium]|nr:pilus assembly protein PilM [Elusimicrobiota bacterium]
MNSPDIDGLITQLAFGKTTPSNLPVLGMHISQEAVYLAETALGSGGKLEARHLVRVPISIDPKSDAELKAFPTAGAAIDKDFLSGGSKAAEILRQSLSQTEWATKNVVVTLSHQLCILRYFVVPSIERRFWKSAIPLQAKKYIPLPFETLSHDFQVFPIAPDAAKNSRSGVLFGVAAKNNLGRIVDFTKSLGLRPMSVEMACLSTLRFWGKARQAGKPNVCCCVHFDGGNIRIILADKGIPVFFREVFLGPRVSLQDQRRLDLEGCVAFSQKQLGVGNVEAVFISGSGVPLENWREAFGKELGINAAIRDEAAPLGLKQGSWDGYAALGASLRFTAPSPISLDLGGIGKIGDDEMRAARTILAASVLVSLWFAVIGAAHFLSYRLRAGELARYRVDPQIGAVLGGKSAMDISTLLDSMRKQLTVLQGVSSGGAPPSAVLRDIGDSVPSGVWVNDVSYENQAANAALDGYGAQSEGRSLEIQGNSQASTPIDEQNAIYEFRDNLSAAPVIGKFFKQIQISIQNQSQYNGGPGSAASPVMAFTLNASARKSE